MVPLVVPHNPIWKDVFAKEARAIRERFGDIHVDVHHIGSTAIPDILAKPIIDLLGVVSYLAEIDAKTDAVETLGYDAMGAYGIEGRRYFRKTDNNGTRTHRLHVFEKGSIHIERHLAFRDYLTAHPDIAKEYSILKEHLVAGGELTWGGYADGKTPFVRRVEPQALDWFRAMKR